MSQVPINCIDVRFLAHATEDPEKVVNAVRTILPADPWEKLIFNRRNIRGHYGNPISFFEAKVKNKSTIKVLVNNLSSNLTKCDKETLKTELNLHVAKNSLYLRLDKQAALLGGIKLCNSDPIRIRIRFGNRTLEDIGKICLALGLFP